MAKEVKGSYTSKTDATGTTTTSVGNVSTTGTGITPKIKKPIKILKPLISSKLTKKPTVPNMKANMEKVKAGLKGNSDNMKANMEKVKAGLKSNSDNMKATKVKVGLKKAMKVKRVKKTK